MFITQHVFSFRLIALSFSEHFKSEFVRETLITSSSFSDNTTELYFLFKKKSKTGVSGGQVATSDMQSRVLGSLSFVALPSPRACWVKWIGEGTLASWNLPSGNDASYFHSHFIGQPFHMATHWRREPRIYSHSGIFQKHVQNLVEDYLCLFLS